MYKSDCYLFFLPNSLFSNHFRGSNRAVTKHSVRCVNPWNSIAFCMLYLAMAPTREHRWTEFIKNYIKYGYTYRWHKELLFSPAFLSQQPWFIFAFSTLLFALPGYPLMRFDRLNESRAIYTYNYKMYNFRLKSWATCRSTDYRDTETKGSNNIIFNLRRTEANHERAISRGSTVAGISLCRLAGWERG